MALPGRSQSNVLRKHVAFGGKQKELCEGRSPGNARDRCASRVRQRRPSPWPPRSPPRSATACRGRSENRIVEIKDKRKDLLRYFRSDAEDREIVVRRIEADRLVKSRTHVIAHIHRGEHREQKELDPELIATGKQRRDPRASAARKPRHDGTRRCTSVRTTERSDGTAGPDGVPAGDRS